VFNLEEPFDLLNELHKEVVGALTFENLRDYDDRLHLSSNAWKKEALFSLLEIFRVSTSCDSLQNVPLEIVLKEL
ncbi:hypothetical protein, partial [Undibacterium sp. Xuan67W]